MYITPTIQSLHPNTTRDEWQVVSVCYIKWAPECVLQKFCQFWYQKYPSVPRHRPLKNSSLSIYLKKISKKITSRKSFPAYSQGAGDKGRLKYPITVIVLNVFATSCEWIIQNLFQMARFRNPLLLQQFSLASIFVVYTRKSKVCNFHFLVKLSFIFHLCVSSKTELFIGRLSMAQTTFAFTSLSIIWNSRQCTLSLSSFLTEKWKFAFEFELTRF